MENKALGTTKEELQLTKEEGLNYVIAKIKSLEGGIVLPKNYSVENAINSAWLKLQEVTGKDNKPALQICTKNSIIESLFNMVLQGLSPAKNQCYFIVYGDKLTLSKSYFGNIAALKRLNGIKNVFANVIYEDDLFDYKMNLENGLKIITQHEQDFRNIDLNKIVGAYAIIVRENEENYVEIMNINQIRESWGMGKAYGKSKAHANFTDEMAKKTVINRAAKNFINTADDSDILIEAINNSLDMNKDREDIIENTNKAVKQEIKEKANIEVLEVKFEEVEEVSEDINKIEPIAAIEENKRETFKHIEEVIIDEVPAQQYKFNTEENKEMGRNDPF